MVIDDLKTHLAAYFVSNYEPADAQIQEQIQLFVQHAFGQITKRSREEIFEKMKRSFRAIMRQRALLKEKIEQSVSHLKFADHQANVAQRLLTMSELPVEALLEIQTEAHILEMASKYFLEQKGAHVRGAEHIIFFFSQ